MDITLLFKACIKTVRTTNKALGLKDQKSNVLKINQKDSNLTKPKEIVKQITNLKNLLSENKAGYLNVINYLSTNKTMSEIDREEIDSAAEKILTTCTRLINEYKKETSKFIKTRQKEEHYLNVIDSVERYLKNVSKLYAETKAIRVKRVLETHKLSKLETKGSNKNNLNQSVSNVDNVTVQVKNEIKFPSLPPVENIENQISAEEMQMFESENELLYNELNAISDEVKQMESKVEHISELQELFTEKVLQQEQEIERIATTVVGATNNVQDANQQIREAIQRNAGLRVWILFFLLLMSFSLLFLDWYNE